MRLIGFLFVLAGFAAPLAAQTNTAPAARQLSLQDCLQLAIRNNLDLHVARFDAALPVFTLSAAYGAYDPTLSLSGQHERSESGTQLVAGSILTSGRITDANSFSSSLEGLLPWGTTYSLASSVSDTYGTSATTRDNLAQPTLITNSFVNLTDGKPITYITTNYGQVPARSPFESSSGSASVSLTQPLLKNFWIDSARLSIRVAKNRLKYSEQTLRLQIMQTITKVEQAYYDWIYNLENVRVQEKAVELAERLVTENRKKVEVGSLAPLDEKNAESQAASSRATLIAARSSLAVQEATLKQYISAEYSSWAEAPLRPSEALSAPRQFFNLRDSWSKGLTLRPEILQARLDLEQAGIQLKYNRNQLYPELDLFGTVGYNGSGREFSDALYDIQQTDRPYYIYGGQLKMPLVRTAARNNYRSQKTVVEQSLMNVKVMERNIMFAIDTDIRQAQSSYEQVGATRAAREYAEAALDAEQKKLESGKSTTYTVLQMQRDLTTARGNEIQALANYNKNLSALSLDEGTTLDRLRVNLEVK